MGLLINVLHKNKDLFSSSVADMSRINPNVITHKLAICRSTKSITQKRRRLGEDKRMATIEETEKLLQTGFIEKIKYTTWLANVVLVKKSDGK